MAKVTLFGSFQDLAGWRTRDVEGGSLGAIRRLMEQENVELGQRLGLPSTLVIVNETLVGRGAATDGHPVAENDDVAFAPPVSGG